MFSSGNVMAGMINTWPSSGLGFSDATGVSVVRLDTYIAISVATASNYWELYWDTRSLPLPVSSARVSICE